MARSLFLGLFFAVTAAFAALLLVPRLFAANYGDCEDVLPNSSAYCNGTKPCDTGGKCRAALTTLDCNNQGDQLGTYVVPLEVKNYGSCQAYYVEAEGTCGTCRPYDCAMLAIYQDMDVNGQCNGLCNKAALHSINNVCPMP